MKVEDLAHISIRGITANKLRTGLTILGMVIGVFSVIVLVSLGSGAKKYVLAEFQGLGSNLIVVQPGKTDQKTSFGPPIGSSSRKMTINDVAALEKKALNLDAVSGLVIGTAQARFEENIAHINVFAVNDQFLKILKLALGQGSFYSREEEDSGRRVVVIGSVLSQKLFGQENPIGKSLALNRSGFRVIGILSPVGEKFGFNFDEFAMIPTHTGLRLFNEDKLFGIRATAKSKVALEDAVSEIKDILSERRNGEEDFTIITQEAMLESMGSLLGMLTYVLGAIAAVSMLVGGIGIMNIMLVSVTERTQEIGIRRAIGATKWNILIQFLAEASLLSLLSGLLGALAAIILTWGVYFTFPSFDMRAPYWIILLATSLAIFVGIIFGIQPARKAANLEIVDALRHH